MPAACRSRRRGGGGPAEPRLVDARGWQSRRRPARAIWDPGPPHHRPPRRVVDRIGYGLHRRQRLRGGVERRERRPRERRRQAVVDDGLRRGAARRHSAPAGRGEARHATRPLSTLSCRRRASRRRSVDCAREGHASALAAVARRGGRRGAPAPALDPPERAIESKNDIVCALLCRPQLGCRLAASPGRADRLPRRRR